MRQRNLVGALRGQRQLLQAIRVIDARVKQDARQPMRVRIVNAGQWKPWTLALEDVVADGRVGRRNGRQWTDERVKVRAVDVVVAAAPKHVAQIARDAYGFASIGSANGGLFSRYQLHRQETYLPLYMIVWILDGVQVHLAGFLVLRAQVVHHMVDCVPREYFEHL